AYTEVLSGEVLEMVYPFALSHFISLSADACGAEYSIWRVSAGMRPPLATSVSNSVRFSAGNSNENSSSSLVVLFGRAAFLVNPGGAPSCTGNGVTLSENTLRGSRGCARAVRLGVIPNARITIE